MTTNPPDVAIGSRQQFFNEPEECLWLTSTALKGVHTPPFNSFVLIGNEDAPEAVYLYAECDPLVTDKRVSIINFLNY